MIAPRTPTQQLGENYGARSCWAGERKYITLAFPMANSIPFLSKIVLFVCSAIRIYTQTQSLFNASFARSLFRSLVHSFARSLALSLTRWLFRSSTRSLANFRALPTVDAIIDLQTNRKCINFV